MASDADPIGESFRGLQYCPLACRPTRDRPRRDPVDGTLSIEHPCGESSIRIGSRHSDTKLPLRAVLSGTNLSGSSNVIDVSNIQYTFNGDYNNSLAGTLSYLPQTKQLGIETVSKQPLSFKLNIPTATVPGNYTGTITLIAVSE